MKKKLAIRTLLIITTLFIMLVIAHLLYLNTMTAKEVYPEDHFLQHVVHKKALIVTAHDDDAYSFSGTIYQLIQDGWEISQVSFKREEEERNRIFYALAKQQGLMQVTLIDGYILPSAKNKTPYKPVPYAHFAEVYAIDSVYHQLSDIINAYQPSVIFSLDDSIGGYGHPDHVFISQQVVRYCNEHQHMSDFPVQRVYQCVMPPSMAESILVKNSWASANIYTEAKKQYGCNGMPLPDVCINIYQQAANKKQYMNSYSAHDRKNIAKISPYYNWYPSWLYFRMFNKEYFRTLSFE